MRTANRAGTCIPAFNRKMIEEFAKGRHLSRLKSFTPGTVKEGTFAGTRTRLADENTGDQGGRPNLANVIGDWSRRRVRSEGKAWRGAAPNCCRTQREFILIVQSGQTVRQHAAPANYPARAITLWYSENRTGDQHYMARDETFPGAAC